MSRGEVFSLILLVVVAVTSADARRLALSKTCKSLPWSTLKAALAAAVDEETSGQNAQMWGTIVDRDGVVCAVAFSGPKRDSQFLSARSLSAAKAFAANAFALDSSSFDGKSGSQTGSTLSTANMYYLTESGVTPGPTLPAVIPMNAAALYAGKPSLFGTKKDPTVGKIIGGFAAFGGGLALYGPGGVAVGGLGLAGDTACTDHRIAWRTRANLKLDYLGGFGGASGDPERPDNIVYLADGEQPVPPKHPNCGAGDSPADLPAVRS